MFIFIFCFSTFGFGAYKCLLQAIIAKPLLIVASNLVLLVISKPAQSLRVFVKNIEDWKKIAETHGKRFKNINPANTLVQAQLVGDEYLVEIEAEAVIVQR